jgi:hypothetical protein
MPRRCTVCDHLESHSIDEALVSSAPYRSVAKRFELSESAVYRHKADHLPAHLLKAREVEEMAQADDLLEQVRHLQAHALDILERAEKAGDLKIALAAISRARSNLELLGKLAETEGLATLHGWLQSGGLFYTPPPQAIVSINNLLHERRRELGIVGVGVVR